jgi:hypothetical protein
MIDLIVSPLSFAPTKVGYKQYVKAGGAMQLASFQVFERRTKRQILAENIDRAYNAMMYNYDLSYLALQDCDGDAYILYTDTADIRAKQLGEYHRELALLDGPIIISRNSYLGTE